MHSIDEIQQRTEQVKRLTDAIRRWSQMTRKYQELRELIDQIRDEREALRIQMAEHHSMLDALQKECRSAGPEIVWHELLYGPKP